MTYSTNFNTQLWRKLSTLVYSDPDQYIQLLQEISDSETRATEEQHPLYMIFSRKYTSIFQNIGFFFLGEDDVMQKIKTLLNPLQIAPSVSIR